MENSNFEKMEYFKYEFEKNDFYLNFVVQNDSAAVTDTIWSSDSKYLMAIYSDNDYTICKN